METQTSQTEPGEQLLARIEVTRDNANSDVGLALPFCWRVYGPAHSEQGLPAYVTEVLLAQGFATWRWAAVRKARRVARRLARANNETTSVVWRERLVREYR